MSPRNRQCYLEDLDARAEILRARAIWQYRRTHVTIDRGELCDDVKAARLHQAPAGEADA
jgi:hypothetical protein